MSSFIKTVVDRSFRNHGFNKKADTWYYDCLETTLVASLQKSQYANCFYINLGVWLKSLGESAAPKEHQCHIRIRLNAMIGKPAEDALNLDNTELDEVERQRIIATAIESAAIPFLMACRSIDGIKDQLEDGRLSKAMINKRIRELVGSK